MMKVKREREVAQSSWTLPDPMDCSLPASSAHGIFQARGLEWVAMFKTKRQLSECNKIFANEATAKVLISKI